MHFNYIYFSNGSEGLSLLPRSRFNLMKTEIVFNVNYPTNDSLLNLADYFCWTIQRVFEKGEIRYYNFIKDQIKLVIDVYDTNNYDKWKNYYDNKRILYLY